jgi:hypothetical protein
VEAEPEAQQEGESTAVGEGTDDALDLEKVKRLWPAVVDHVRQQGEMVLSALFENARPLDVDNKENVLRVGFPASATFNKKKAEAQPNRELFAEAVRQIIGQSLRPVYVLLENDGEGEKDGPELTEEELIERVKTEFDAEEEHSAAGQAPETGGEAGEEITAERKAAE